MANVHVVAKFGLYVFFGCYTLLLLFVSRRAFPGGSGALSEVAAFVSTLVLYAPAIYLFDAFRKVITDAQKAQAEAQDAVEGSTAVLGMDRQEAPDVPPAGAPWLPVMLTEHVSGATIVIDPENSTAIAKISGRDLTIYPYDGRKGTQLSADPNDDKPHGQRVVSAMFVIGAHLGRRIFVLHVHDESHEERVKMAQEAKKHESTELVHIQPCPRKRLVSFVAAPPGSFKVNLDGHGLRMAVHAAGVRRDVRG